MKNSTRSGSGRRLDEDSNRIYRRADDSDTQFECSAHGCHASAQVKYRFPIAVCAHHLIKVMAASSEVSKAAQREHFRANGGAPMPFSTTKTGRIHDPIVYYIRFGDRIKIGTTSNLQRRLEGIPHDEVLATEPGSYPMESRRHKQFRAARLTGEWFSMAPKLMEHIDRLKAAQAA